MSWRDVLAANNLLPTQYPHNTHNSPMRGGSADIADSAVKESRIMAAIRIASHDQPISPSEVRDSLAPEDIAEWHKGAISVSALVDIVAAIVRKKDMEAGNVPTHYTEKAVCEGCGPVWLWFSGEVLGCPWCWIAAADRPVPHPDAADHATAAGDPAERD